MTEGTTTSSATENPFAYQELATEDEIFSYIFSYSLIGTFCIHLCAGLIAWRRFRKEMSNTTRTIMFPLGFAAFGVLYAFVLGGIFSFIISAICAEAKFIVLRWHAMVYGIGLSFALGLLSLGRLRTY